MTRGNRLLAFAAFFASGLCALLYQVIWVRLAFARFGIIMPVVSVVLSVFMAGNAIGAWGGGLLAGRLAARGAHLPLLLYAAAEGVIGVGSLAVPALFTAGQSLMLGLDGMDSIPYLLLSAVALGVALLPWCVMMGATYPLMMAFLKRAEPAASARSFSLLYLANVIGAMTGAFASAFVLVEKIGFAGTLAVGGALNLAIAAGCAWRALAIRRSPTAAVTGTGAGPAGGPRGLGTVETILFTTGFTTLALEIVWTRMFTPALKTTVYAFAGLLIVYLAATWMGSSVYRSDLSRNRVLPLHTLLGAAMITVFLPALMNDPRWFFYTGRLGQAISSLASIVPFCIVLGYLTPRLIDEGAAGAPAAAGRLYACNIIGCILGPLAASYLLLPIFGAKHTLAILGIPYVLLFLSLSAPMRHRARAAAAFAGVILLVLSGTAVINMEAPFPKGLVQVRRDYAATVTYGGRGNAGKFLLVDGVGITNLTPVTKNMAHLPLIMLPRPPESGLVICFGMGTTWRSLMSWGIEATAVELVPSVRDAFPYFHSDAGSLMEEPRGRIVIDDGRRFLMRTDRRFDVITIDPPPPVEASGSSLLYSDEFYRLARARLTDGGILQQWSPISAADGGQVDSGILVAIARSITDAFPHVRAFASIEGWGVHFLASDAPISVPSPEEAAARLPADARADFLEWFANDDATVPLALMTRREIRLDDLLRDHPRVRITDNRPFNEYFLLRRLGLD
jgi:spermidine synthase